MHSTSTAGIDTAIKTGLIAPYSLWYFQIAKPFLGPVVLAGIIAIAVYPLSIYAFNDPETGTIAAIAFLTWNIVVGLLNNVLKPIEQVQQ